eukprot:14867917-Alexandrium_andersonii.AAC.1
MAVWTVNVSVMGVEAAVYARLWDNDVVEEAVLLMGEWCLWLVESVGVAVPGGWGGGGCYVGRSMGNLKLRGRLCRNR